MGNAAIRKVPEDLTKCTDLQLRYMINSVIINNPWNEDDGQSEEDSLNETIDIMYHKGFRPITPQEYVEELKRLRNEPAAGKQGVKVWLPISGIKVKICDDAPSTPKKYCRTDGSATSSPHTTNSAKLSIRCSDIKESRDLFTGSSMEDIDLPCSREDAAYEILRSGASDAVLSELTNTGYDEQDNIVTEEWPANGVSNKQKYHRHHLQF